MLYEERLGIGERIRDIARAADGTIWLWTDSAKLIALTTSDASATIAAMIEIQPPAIAEALAKCGACHAFDPESSENEERLAPRGGPISARLSTCTGPERGRHDVDDQRNCMRVGARSGMQLGSGSGS